jgi:hypothetical protein
MANQHGWKDFIRRVSRLFRIRKIKPGDLLEMAIQALEDSKVTLRRGQAPVAPDHYCLSLPGESFDEFTALKDTLEKRIADQLRAYAADAGYILHKNHVKVLLIRMPSSRRGYVHAETFFSPDTDLKNLTPDEPADMIRIHYDGDSKTMVFGSLNCRQSWKDNYMLSSEKDLDDLHEIVRFIDAGACDEAGDLLEKLLAVNPSHNGLWILNDYIHYRKGDSAALDRLQSRTLLVKDDPLLSSALAIMMLEKGNPESALWETLESLNTHPDHPLPALVLAQTYHELDLPVLAAERMRHINLQESIDPEIPDLMRRYITRPTGRAEPEKRSSRFFKLLYHESTPADGMEKRELIDTRKTKVIIGRDGGSAHPDIALNDNRVSSIHCQIVYSKGLFYIIDCNSRNGVYVNGKKSVTYQLKSGDVIRLGDTKLVFEC